MTALGDELRRVATDLEAAAVDVRAAAATADGAPTPTPTPTPGPPAGADVNFAWLNETTAGSLTGAEVVAIVAALNAQEADLTGAWPGIGTAAHFVAADAPPGAIVCHLQDDAQVAGALGWHDVDSNGIPYMVIGVGTVLGAGGAVLSGPLSVAGVCSHEALETRCDPTTGSWSPPFPADYPIAAVAGYQIALEVGDPVETTGYDIGPVSLSNFVCPAYFDPAGTGPYDHNGLVGQPGQDLPGGYLIRRAADGTVDQVFGEQLPEYWKVTAVLKMLQRAGF